MWELQLFLHHVNTRLGLGARAGARLGLARGRGHKSAGILRQGARARG